MDTPTPNPNAPVIEMHGVTVGALHDLALIVLEEVDWTVQAGEFWVVAGLHRSGKSDLMAMTAGLTPPVAGSYRLFGYDMPIFEGELLKERLRVGLVFEGGQLLHNLTIRENIALPLRYHRRLDYKELEDRVGEMLKTMELESCAEALPSGLARETRKRAGLARALMLQPEVLLLDDPLRGLDLRQVSWWLDLLQKLAAGHELMESRRMTLAATAEDLRPWRQMACHFAALRERRFVEVGGPDQLKDHQEAVVREMLAEGLPRS